MKTFLGARRMRPCQDQRIDTLEFWVNPDRMRGEQALNPTTFIASDIFSDLILEVQLRYDHDPIRVFIGPTGME